MLFQEFHSAMSAPAIFTSNQVYAWRPGFDKNNFTRWTKKGLLIKLRNGYYTFPEFLHEPNFAFFVANKIYKPSYISLHSALAFYGLIPETIVQLTSVSTRKTNTFENPFGTFSYKTIKPQVFFGYDPLPFSGEKKLLMAKPEKALLDLLYLYPFYKTKNDFLNLRLDESFIEESFNIELLQSLADGFKSATLANRVKNLLKVIV
ncbi:MAG: hypothetical protein WC271_08570 [Bacteroidales bacterium]|jgi:predicted transcriptional regulator of viral defense system|nr:hypothetical protein [Bacteroidales bacterium]NLO51367.1 hypothetical protein [Bacteroidales bacterium]